MGRLQPGTGQRGIAASAARRRSSSRAGLEPARVDVTLRSPTVEPALLGARRRDCFTTCRGSGVGAYRRKALIISAVTELSRDGSNRP